ncbi:beta-galactosidase [uncultured Victivallis sp.]|uniref:GH39 family glycosyl hydrolase n=1 Tax=uncultured Victivallis sp. TaxID=354118 RepID=UPI002596BD6D|nr:beta-galactosidase [uncultured Victivallis sp.]
MKYLLLLLLTASATVICAPVWQLGVEDGSSREFLPYSSLEFQTSRQLLNSPGYKDGCFTCRISGGGKQDASAIPPGLTGGTAGNRTPIRKLQLLWTEKEAGFREFEFRILYAADRNYRSHRITPNENMDLDSTDWAPCGVRIAAPGRRMAFQYVPYDVERYLEKNNGPLVVKIAFPVKAGENSIELSETSGNSYGRVFHFDYLKLTALDSDRRPVPYAEFGGHRNFAAPAVYRVGDRAKAGVAFHNLEPGRPVKARVDFIDYLGKTVLSRPLELHPDRDGFARTEVDVPENRSGHFRLRAFLEERKEKLAETRIAGIREIAPLNDREVEQSFIGLSGIDPSSLFEPENTEKFERYARLQKLLQFRHERIHSLPWQFVEPAEHQYHWETWDRMIELLKENDIHIQLTLLGTPRWLLDRHFPGKEYRHLYDSIFAPVPDMEKWREYCTLVARRYGDSVKEFEIWNEVSEQSIFWPEGNAEQFFELVKNASEAIKAVHPEAKIVAETLWPRQNDFIHEIFRLGIAGYVDIHADHYMNDLRIAQSREMLEKYVPGGILIDNETHTEAAGNPLGQVDDASRIRAAQMMVRNYFHHNAQGVRRIYNFLLFGATWRKWGLMGPDETPKFTFSVFKTLINRTAGAEFDSYCRLSGSLELFLYRYTSPERARTNGGEYLAILCSSGAESETLMLPSLAESCRRIDIMDNEMSLAAPGRIVTVDVGAEPVMLAGIDRAALAALSKLKISGGKGSLRPGEAIEVELSLPEEAAEGRFTLNCSDGREESVRLAGGERHTVRMPVGRELSHSVVTLKISGEIETGERKLPVTRFCEYVVEEKAPGSNLLAPFHVQNWMHWGKGNASYPEGRAVVSIDSAEGAGAITTRNPVDVIPGCRYLLDFSARGSGTLRVMLVGTDRAGKPRELTHNLLSEKLSAGFKTFRREWFCPDDIVKLGFHFYEFNTIGNFEILNSSFLRLHNDLPLNRQLCKVEASAGKPVFDGELTGFRKELYRDVIDRTMLSGPEELRASFAVAADPGTIYIGVKVHDPIHAGGNPDELYTGDSIQVDFDLGDGTVKSPTAQFGFALIDGKAITFRHSVIPAADIVSTYKLGPSPAGVSCKITRKGEETIYEAAIPVEAIHPQLILKPGMKLGFSLLVNQNSGSGRQGFLQWSSGIGRERDSTQFGELTLPDPL